MGASLVCFVLSMQNRLFMNRGVCLIKEPHPRIHDHYGCRGKKINHTVSQVHFSSSSCLSSTHPGFFFGSVQARISGLWRSVSYQNLMRKQAGEYTWGISKSFFRVTALPSVLLIPSP